MLIDTRITIPAQQITFTTFTEHGQRIDCSPVVDDGEPIDIEAVVAMMRDFREACEASHAARAS